MTYVACPRCLSSGHLHHGTAGYRCSSCGWPGQDERSLALDFDRQRREGSLNYVQAELIAEMERRLTETEAGLASLGARLDAQDRLIDLALGVDAPSGPEVTR